MTRYGDYPRNPKEDFMYQVVIKKSKKASKLIDVALIAALIIVSILCWWAIFDGIAKLGGE